MFDEYEYYQGVVLRQIVANASSGVRIAPFVREGRVSAYVLNDNVGVFIKHSSKRLPPWTFSFHSEQVADLLDLVAKHFDTFVVFVCGEDGAVSLGMDEIHKLVSLQESQTAWIRIGRRPRSMYDVSGNRGELEGKKSRGTGVIVEALERIGRTHG